MYVAPNNQDQNLIFKSFFSHKTDCWSCSRTVILIHVISPDFGSNSQIGAFSPGLPRSRRNLQMRGFSNVIFPPTIFLYEHFIIYGSNLPA